MSTPRTRPASHFRLSRPATIGLAVLIVMALAGAGLLAGGLMGQPAPAGRLAPPSPPSPTPSSTGFAPVGSVTIALARGAPVPLGAAGVPELTTTTRPTEVVIGGNVATIPLPRPWRILSQTDVDVFLEDRRNDWIYAQASTAAPTSDPVLVLGHVFDTIIANHYSNVRTSDVVRQEPYGSMTGIAAVAYQGTSTDQQGSLEVLGNLWVAIRSDGAVLSATAETAPPSDFEAHEPNRAPVIDGAFSSFAAVGAEEIPPGCTIVGSAGADILTGTNGDDVICGLGGNDTLTAGRGNDVLFGGSGSDSLDAGPGDDVASGGTGADLILGGPGIDRLLGESGGDTTYAGTGPDTIFGGRSDDILYGEGGIDVIHGGPGDDVLFGDPTGELSTDYLFGDKDDDVLDGGGGDDRLVGGRGADRMFGSEGNDCIDSVDGTFGNDVLVGGPDLDDVKRDSGDTPILTEHEVAACPLPDEGI